MPPIQPPLWALGRRWTAVASAQDGAYAYLALAQEPEEAVGPLDDPGQVVHERPTAYQVLGLCEGPVDDRALALLHADPNAEDVEGVQRPRWRRRRRQSG